MRGPPQRTAPPTPVGEPGGGVDRPAIQHADPPNMAAHGSDEASAVGQPGTEPEGPMPDAECGDGGRPSSAQGAQPTGRPGAAPLANIAHHANASTPRETPPRDPAETRATSETREATPDTPQSAAGRETSPSGHNRDDNSFDAFIESCMGDPQTVPTLAAPRVHPEPQSDHAGDTPLTIPRHTHFQRNHTALGRTRQVTAANEGHAAASGAADRTTNECSATGSGARVEAGTNTASEATGPLPGTAPCPGDGETWTTHAWRATPAAPATKRNKRRHETWAYGSPGFPQGSSSPWQSASDGCLLRRPATSRRAPAPWQKSPLAIGRSTRPPPPWTTPPNGTMWPPGSWRNPDEMNGLHWQWHQRAALRICAIMQEHNIWDIPRSPGYQGHASGHRRPRSQDVPEPPRQAARRNSPARPRGPLPGVGPPSGTYRSPLRPFAPRRGPGSPVLGMQDGTPERPRRPGTLADPVAAAARRLPRHGESSSMRVWTGTRGAPATPTPNRHHLPPIPDASPRGPAPNGRTSLPFSRQSSASDRQRFTRTPTGRQAERPAHPPPPSQGPRPTRCGGDHTPRTLGRGSLRPTQGLRKGWGDSPPHSPQAAKARRAHRNNGGATRAAQGRTQK